MGIVPTKKSAHEKHNSQTKAARATRKAIKKPDNSRKAGPGRPKGSTLHPEWRLTPRQMEIVEKMIEAETDNGFFPVSIQELARKIKADPKYVRDVLRNDKAQEYLNFLLKENGIVLEMQFWRGMALGLQVGDPKVLTLYARMTGKISKEQNSKLQIEIISPDGTRLALPNYNEEIIDAEVVEEEDEGD